MITDYTSPMSNPSFVIRHSYTWGMDLSGSMHADDRQGVQAFQSAGGVGGLFAVNELSILNSQLSITSFFPTYDGNGNVSEYLDATGTVVAHYEYDSFGNTTVATGTKKDDFSHRFSTKPLDAETGLYYYGYRYYDPVTGRWSSRDPIWERGGFNLYGFVGNDGVNKLDYLGLMNMETAYKIIREAIVTITFPAGLGEALTVAENSASFWNLIKCRKLYMLYNNALLDDDVPEKTEKKLHDAYLKWCQKMNRSYINEKSN